MEYDQKPSTLGAEGLFRKQLRQGIGFDDVKRVRSILGALDEASIPGELGSPGYACTRSRAGLRIMAGSGKFRVTLRFIETGGELVDSVHYH